MINDCNNFLFLTCDNDKIDIEKCKNDERIESIYNVCGLNPWLIVYKESIDNAKQNIKKYRLNIQHWSYGKILKIDKQKAKSKNENLFWIFIKGYMSEEFIKNITKLTDGFKNFRIEEIFDIFGEFEYVIKIYTSHINGVDDFLAVCQEKSITASTKCVLSTMKEDHTNLDEHIDEKRRNAKSIQRDIPYSVARIMANTEGFVRKNKEEQKTILFNNLKEMQIPFNIKEINNLIFDPDLSKTEYYQSDLKHPNDLIELYSIKLDRDGWLQTLLFFKASGPKEKKILEKVLQEQFLGVTSSRFSRKLHYMTGDYDFMIPFDSKDIDVLTRTVDEFIQNNEELITNFTNTVCRPEVRGRGTGRLNPLDIPFIQSLLINSTKITELEQKVKNKEILTMSQNGISPREDCIRHKISTVPEITIDEYLDKVFVSFENIGIEPTIEFKDSSMVQVFLKFHLRSNHDKNSFIDDINVKKQNYEIIATIYQPIRDPRTVMCVLLVKDFVELEVILNDLGKYCRKTEFHIIFHKRFYSKIIDQSIICKPCFYPQKIQNCGSCIRYILPRKKNSLLNVDFDDNYNNRKIKEEIRITLIGVDIGLPDYFILEELLDEEKECEIIFNNYKNYCERNNFTEFYEEARQYYKSIKSKKEYREKYEHAIIKVLKDNMKSYIPDIIVLPEYSIPSYVYHKISEMNYNYENVIIAGSHIDKKRYNVCPIIFNGPNGKKIYHTYKNNCSPFEKQLGLIENVGTAHLKFFNTEFGNLLVKICYDVHFTSHGGNFENVDILLVPSFNYSKPFKNAIETKVEEYKLVAVYANTINNGEVDSNIIIPSEDGINASLIDIKSFHKDKWNNSKISLYDEIFYPIPQNNKLEEVMEEGFGFKIKHLTFNIMELDKMREIKSK